MVLYTFLNATAFYDLSTYTKLDFALFYCGFPSLHFRYITRPWLYFTLLDSSGSV